MKRPGIPLLINSTLAFVAAFLVTTFIHEGGHFLSYLLFGESPTLYHNYVQVNGPALPLHVRVVSALAGPLISLVQGGVCWALLARGAGGSTRRLLLLWLSLLGFVNFFGYLVMTPLSTAGDTGKVAGLLTIAYPIRIVIAVVGFALLLWILMAVGRYFAHFIPRSADEPTRAGYVYRLMFFPILIGSVANSLLSFPIPVLLSVIYPATSSFAIMSTFPAIMKAHSPGTGPSELAARIRVPLGIALLLLIAANRLLTFGLG